MTQPVHYSDIFTTMQNGKKVSFRVVIAELFIWTVSVKKKRGWKPSTDFLVLSPLISL